MNQKTLSIKWADGRNVGIHLEDNPVAEFYYKCIKHLRHVDLEFNARKNPLHPLRDNLDEVKEHLKASATKLGIELKTDKLSEQEYLNYLHTLYFASTNGVGSDSDDWLEFHDQIHLIEQVRDGKRQPSLWFDYEYRAGFLIKPFDRTWLNYSVTNFPAGTCYIQARELGKDIFKYIEDNEPFDIAVMSKLLKPWVDFKPVLDVSIQDQDRLTKLSHFYADYKNQIDNWFCNFKEPWTEHWKLSNWKITDEVSVLPIGQVDNLTMLIDCFKMQDYPTRITY